MLRSNIKITFPISAFIINPNNPIYYFIYSLSTISYVYIYLVGKLIIKKKKILMAFNIYTKPII